MISLTADQLDQIIGGGLRRYGIAPRIVLRPPRWKRCAAWWRASSGSPCCRTLPTAPGPWSRSGSRPAPSRSPSPPSTSVWCGGAARALTGPHASSSTSPEIRAGYGPASTSPLGLSLNSRDSGKKSDSSALDIDFTDTKAVKIEILIAPGFSYAHGWLTGC